MARELTSEEMEQLLMESLYGRLALSRDNTPYVITLCFAYAGDALYMHGSLAGRKIDYLQANSRACFQVDEVLGLIEGEKPCFFSVNYRSVLLEGEVTLVEDEAEKQSALELLAAKYAGSRAAGLIEDELARVTAVMRLAICNKSSRAGS